MIRRCEACYWTYDDAEFSTTCPHTKSITGRGVLCRYHDLFNCTLPHEPLQGVELAPEPPVPSVLLTSPMTPEEIASFQSALTKRPLRITPLPFYLEPKVIPPETPAPPSTPAEPIHSAEYCMKNKCHGWEPTGLFAPREDKSDSGPSCWNCGEIMVRSGTCHRCTNCGEQDGCG